VVPADFVVLIQVERGALHGKEAREGADQQGHRQNDGENALGFGFHQ